MNEARRPNDELLAQALAPEGPAQLLESGAVAALRNALLLKDAAPHLEPAANAARVLCSYVRWCAVLPSTPFLPC